MMGNKLINSIVKLCIISTLASVSYSCGNGEPKNIIVDKYTEKLMQTIAKPNQEAVMLLSQKYDLQPGLVESFLDSYLTDTDGGYKLLKESLKPSNAGRSKPDAMELFGIEKESYIQALVKASQSNGITPKTAALLVTDYKLFTARGNSGE